MDVFIEFPACVGFVENTQRKQDLDCGDIDFEARTFAAVKIQWGSQLSYPSPGSHLFKQLPQIQKLLPQLLYSLEEHSIGLQAWLY